MNQHQVSPPGQSMKLQRFGPAKEEPGDSADMQSEPQQPIDAKTLADRNQQRQAEFKQEQARDRIRKVSTTKYVSKQALEEDDPSMKDGMERKKVVLWRRQYCRLIQNAGVALSIPQWGIATAVLLCHRFFALRSMKRNDRFQIASACLFLAAKIEESPKALTQHVQKVGKIQHKDKPAMLKKLEDPHSPLVESLKEEVLQAERAVLYTLAFALSIEHPYKFLLQNLSKLELLKLDENDPFKPLMQNAWNFVNDSLRTTLGLQFPPEQIAAAGLWLAESMNDMKLNIPGKVDFFTYFEVPASVVIDIAREILELYEETKLVGIAKEMAVASGDGALGSISPPTVGSTKDELLLKTEMDGVQVKADEVDLQ